MNAAQNRKEIKLISRQLYKNTAPVSIPAAFVAFVIMTVLPLLISYIFAPTMDASELMDAYAAGADQSVVFEITRNILLNTYTPRNIALLAAIGLVTVLIQGPMAMGAASFFNDTSCGKTMKISNIFSWFKNSRRALKAFWLTLLMYIIEGILFFVFYMLPFVLLMLMGMLNFPAALMIPIFVFSIFVCIFFLAVIIIRLSLAVYVMAILDCRAGRAIGYSFKITRGRAAFETFAFTVSFIGYILLCIITFGAGMIFLMPYFMTAHSIYTRRLLFKNELLK